MDTKDTDTTEAIKSFTIRVPELLARRMAVAAAYEGKSREQWIREALELVVTKVEEQRS